MEFSFTTVKDLSSEGRIPEPLEILKRVPWGLWLCSVPVLLAGNDEALDRFRKKFFGNTNCIFKTGEPTAEEEKIVVGNLGDSLNQDSEIIIAETMNLIKADESAKLLGYHPAKAGEFLQILALLEGGSKRFPGWYYSYAGRIPGYAILSRYDYKGNIREIIFDTQVNYEGQKTNEDTFCFFVK
jgi:hypothetical protein